MRVNLTEATVWQRKLASLIRSGLLIRAEMGVEGSLFTVVGVYHDGLRSAPLAKYADSRRAEDALIVIARLAALAVDD